VLTGTDRPLVARIYGQDEGVLRAEARKVRQALSEIDGVVDPRIVLPPSQPTLQIEVDLERAQRFGIKPGDVRRAEATLLQGLQVGSVFQQQKVFDVVVQGVPQTRRSVADVRNLLIDRPGGGHVRLGQVADVRVRPTPAVIQRDAVSRRVDVEAGVSGRSLDAVADDADARLAALSFPLEYHAEVLRETTGSEIGSTRMLAFAAAAAIAAFLLLQAFMRSWRLALLTFAAMPVALAGGVPAALLASSDLSLGAAAGFLAVFGIAIRHALLLVGRARELEREGVPFGPELVERAARERLGPVLATTLGLVALAIPFVVLGTRAGLEVVHPMAVVLIGGLVTTTLVSLFVLPALFLRMARPIDAALPAEEELLHRWLGAEERPDPAEPAPVPSPAGPTGGAS
jgi:Cu/Ag efflux pump CusA